MLPTPNHPGNPAGKRWFSYLQTASGLVRSYNGQEPLSAFLKKYFAAHKKHGSTDRKNIASLCYGYYRLGFAAATCSADECWQIVVFLFGPASSIPFLLPAEWQSAAHLAIEEKLQLLQGWVPHFNVQQIFPLQAHLSPELDVAAFTASHLNQPHLFLRIRPGQQAGVEKKLQSAGIPFTYMAADAIAVQNNTPVDQLLELDREVVVQDLSSQQIARFFDGIQWKENTPRVVWDCCAASGGKSLLALDRIKNIELTVSDIRSSVLANLNKRLAKAGWKNYTQLEVDLTKTTPHLPRQQLIICDAPCSGSGTWGRTPENIRFFTEEHIRHYTERQRAILAHILPLLQAGGYLLYITCSVFREENEEMVSWLLQESGMELVKQEVIKGYRQQADTMFGALLRKV